MLAHVSSKSGIPSLSESKSHPLLSTPSKPIELGHRSRPSYTPSSSSSIGHPQSTNAPRGVFAQRSSASRAPSPSSSSSHPDGKPSPSKSSESSKPGHVSSVSGTPSPSSSPNPPMVKFHVEAAFFHVSLPSPSPLPVTVREGVADQLYSANNFHSFSSEFMSHSSSLSASLSSHSIVILRILL